jgi:hypothetical protein
MSGLSKVERLDIPQLIGEGAIQGYFFSKGATIFPTQAGDGTDEQDGK